MTADSEPSRGRERQRVDKRHLPRLAPEFYRGRACIHWTLTTENRAVGWLTPEFFPAWQLALLHACARAELISPAFVLMPDHIHLLWLGPDDDGSDQRPAIEFLRKNLVRHLAPADWQRQPFDHVLSDKEREHAAFSSTAHYIFENPVRAGLISHWKEYPHLGCCVPGYPEFDVRADDYWERFWRCYNYLIGKPRA